MKKSDHIVYTNLPENLIKNLNYSFYSLNLSLKKNHNMGLVGNSRMHPTIVKNQLETINKILLNKIINFYEKCLLPEKLTDDCKKNFLREHEVNLISIPKIEPNTIYLTNFGIRSDTLHYRYSEGHDFPFGETTIEFIGYSKK